MRLSIVVGILAVGVICSASAAKEERKSDADMSYSEQLSQYKKLKEPAQDFMDKIMYLREQSYITMFELSKKVELSDDDIGRWEALNKKFAALRGERDKLFGPPPVVQFYGCSVLAGMAALAWNAQYHYFTKVVMDGQQPEPSDFTQVVLSDTDFAKMAARCQQGIETPPEKPDPDEIIVDASTPVN